MINFFYINDIHINIDKMISIEEDDDYINVYLINDVIKIKEKIDNFYETFDSLFSENDNIIKLNNSFYINLDYVSIINSESDDIYKIKYSIDCISPKTVLKR